MEKHYHLHGAENLLRTLEFRMQCSNMFNKAISLGQSQILNLWIAGSIPMIWSVF